jgi:hypothetical protein
MLPTWISGGNMETARYNIVFPGELRAGYAREDVKNNLATIFNLSVNQLESNVDEGRSV